MAKGSWTDTTDKQLLLAVIHLTAPSAPKWDQVATMMGDGFTAESVRQHFQKLKKAAAADASDAAPAATSAASAPKTPKKRATGKKAAGESTGKSSTERKAKEVVSEDADEDDEESPTKKVKYENEAFF